MTKLKRIPAKITRVRTSDGQDKLVPSIPLSNIIIDRPEDSLHGELKELGERYEKLLAFARGILRTVEGEKRYLAKVNPLLFWSLGNAVLTFIQENRKNRFYLDGLYEHLTRDLGISRSSLKKILTFRRRFARKKEIDTSKTWTYYRQRSLPQEH